jgi:hypothetical protein
VQIAAPAFVQFAAEPLARLIDTAYLGRLGQNALGGAGAAIAAQYSVSKLYNDPLLRTTISIVAAKESAPPEERANAVSTALLLALVVGVAQGAAFFALAGPVLSALSVGPASPMRASALAYLRVCSCGAPAVTLWLATNGVFRGLGDTTTPLVWALVFTALNATLDPLCAQPPTPHPTPEPTPRRDLARCAGGAPRAIAPPCAAHCATAHCRHRSLPPPHSPCHLSRCQHSLCDCATALARATADSSSS